MHFSRNIQFSSNFHQNWTEDPLCMYQHILPCIKQIMFAHTTISFHVSCKLCLQVHTTMLFHISSKLCTTISFLVSHKSCVSALPYPFLYQANHVCAYYHILSCIKQIMFASTTMLFHVSSKLCTTISFLVSYKSCVSALPYPFLYLQVLPCCFTYQENYELPYHFLYQANHVCKVGL